MLRGGLDGFPINGILCVCIENSEINSDQRANHRE
jgi:hypothetical protein